MPISNIYDTFSNIIDTIRTQSIITAILDNNDNTYTITVKTVLNKYVSALDLVNSDYITISGSGNINGQYKIKNLTSNSFDIDKVSGTTFALGTYTHNKPYFDFEKWDAESNKLTVQNISKEYNLQKFPLIFMLLDVSETQSLTNVYSQISPTFFIITQTQPDKRANWRLENIYKPLLYPIAESFKNAVLTSKHTLSESVTIERTDRFFLGTSDNSQNNLNQYVDAIELTFNNIRLSKSVICRSQNDYL